MDFFFFSCAFFCGQYRQGRNVNVYPHRRVLEVLWRIEPCYSDCFPMALTTKENICLGIHAYFMILERFRVVFSFFSFSWTACSEVKNAVRLLT